MASLYPAFQTQVTRFQPEISTTNRPETTVLIEFPDFDVADYKSTLRLHTIVAAKSVGII